MQAVPPSDRALPTVAVTKRRAYMIGITGVNLYLLSAIRLPGLLILGLAPGAHGANRTGRMFTGDRSGDFLYRSLYSAGFASQPTSRSIDDGLELHDAWITASGHCAPPGNKPTPEELRNCRPFLQRELELLTNVRVVVVLGKIAFDTYLTVLKSRGADRAGCRISGSAMMCCTSSFRICCARIIRASRTLPPAN